MVSRFVEEIYDDITGEPGAHHLTFAVNRVEYSIDLVSLDPVYEALRPFLAVARPSRRPMADPATGPNPRNVAIRRWAAEQGMRVSERGRIPGAIQAAYRRATQELDDAPAE